jgi:hypothetical protein
MELLGTLRYDVIGRICSRNTTRRRYQQRLLGIAAPSAMAKEPTFKVRKHRRTSTPSATAGGSRRQASCSS